MQLVRLMEFKHTSILLHESVDFLIIDKNGIYVDCTMGGAGHSSAFAAQLEAGGMLIGIDQDDDAIAAGSERLLNKFACKTVVAKSNFESFAQVLDSMGIEQIDGIFFDLGVSSYQLDTPERGFSYMHDGPLDMRMNKEAKLDAEYIVNHYKEDRYARLRSMAKRTGKQVQRSKVDVELDPMPNDERKVIHKALSEWHNLRTDSEGEGSNRHVCIRYVADKEESEAE